MSQRRSLFVLCCSMVLATSACDDETGPSQGLTVYEHPNFGGRAQTFDGNVFDLDDVRGPCTGFFDSSSDGDWDDCISSVRISPGWQAVVYEHDEYEGETLTIGADIRDLDDVPGPCGDDWDDCISSFRIIPP